MQNLVFLPAPRQVMPAAGQFTLDAGRLILLQASRPADLRYIGQRLQAAMQRHAGVTWELAAGIATPPELIGATLRLAATPELAGRGEQAYHLSIRPDGVTVQAAGAAGLFYGVGTLAQIIEQTGRALPCLEILDWPDYPARGVMLDISRDKVPSMATVYGLVDMLSSWKINQLQLYTEHTFAYRGHPEVWAHASPMTGQEIMDLDAYCRERYVELVPSQNSFGHMDRWLRHPRYEGLAEILGEIETPWGPFRGPFSLCAVDPGSLELVCSLYDELLPHFSSRQFNVGCDETWDLGQGRSRDACLAAGGAAPVYLDFLLQIQAQVQARGHTMQFWADIVSQHPEFIPPALQDSVALEWGYEADHPFAEHAAQLAAAGVPFYVCPGTSAWCSVAGRTANALENLRSAAAHGLAHGATGYLNTDWGDRGHWQALPVSYLGFAAGAAYSWALQANDALDLAGATSRYAFHDPTGALGRVAYDLGNVYRAVGHEPHNASALFQILQAPFAKVLADRGLGHLPKGAFDRAEAAIDQAIQPLAGACPEAADAGLLYREFRLTERLLRHACARGRLIYAGRSPAHGASWRCDLDMDLQEIITEYCSVWLARNRQGGLVDSVARFERSRQDYLA